MFDLTQLQIESIHPFVSLLIEGLEPITAEVTNTETNTLTFTHLQTLGADLEPVNLTFMSLDCRRM